MTKKFCIYKHTSPSGKSYIGQTNNYSVRCSSHKKSTGCRAFSSAINKYGWENFTHEILEDGLTLDEANEREQFYIENIKTLYPNGYNLTTGGQSCIKSDDTRKLMSEIVKNKHKDIEFKMQFLKQRNDPEFRKLQSEKAKKAHANPETKIKHSEAVKFALSKPESKEAKSKAAIERMSSPEIRKAISEKTKIAMSDPIEKAKRVAARLQTMSNPEVKKKHSDSLKAAYSTKESREKISSIVKKSWEDPEIRAKRIESQKATRNSPEHKEKMSALRATPEWKARNSAAQKARRAREKEERSLKDKILTSN